MVETIRVDDNDRALVPMVLPVNVEKVRLVAFNVLVIQLEYTVNRFAFNVLPLKVDKTRLVKLMVHAFSVEILITFACKDE